MVGMAKRRKRSTASAAKIIRVGAPRAAAPIIRVSAPRAAPAKRRRRGGRRRSSSMGLGFGGGVVGSLVPKVIGGAAYGFVVKQGWVDKLPSIPIVGRTGAAAIALQYFSRHGGGQLAANAASAAAYIAGYQLGTEGAIHGDASPDSYGDETYAEDDA